MKEFNKLERENAFHNFNLVPLLRGQFLMPGFVDCHTHAPQFPNLGVITERPRLEVDDRHTIRMESQFGDPAYAKKVYRQVVVSTKEL